MPLPTLATQRPSGADVDAERRSQAAREPSETRGGRLAATALKVPQCCSAIPPPSFLLRYCWFNYIPADLVALRSIDAFVCVSCGFGAWLQ